MKSQGKARGECDSPATRPPAQRSCPLWQAGTARPHVPASGRRRMFALQLHPPRQLSINTSTYLSADRKARSTRGSHTVSLSSITWVRPRRSNPTSTHLPWSENVPQSHVSIETMGQQLPEPGLSQGDVKKRELKELRAATNHSKRRT